MQSLYSCMKSPKLEMPVTALHTCRVRTNHRLCAALSSSAARVSLQRCAKRVSESTLPRVRARQMGTAGRINMPRRAKTVSRPKLCQCCGGATVGDIANLMNVDSRFGCLAMPALAAPVRALTELTASTPKHSSAPKEVVKTRTCSQARMPHHVAQHAQSLMSLSNRPASTSRVACVCAKAFATCTDLSFMRAASANRVSPTAVACVARDSSCSAISFCRARLG
mmetsp:Transcript_73001/g.217877  ORF Transcript_73001/g.217877 Transcript_73001/m.217877 type:complete len:224 (+) Transcript_73001:229-900(+)